MLSREALERYRRLTNSERLELSIQAMREAMPHLLAGPPEVVARQFAAIRRENDLRNEAMLTRLAEAQRGDS